MGKRIPNLFNLLVVIYVALGSTACSYGMAIIGSTVGQPTFYTSLKMAPPGTPGYSRTANLLSAYNGVNAAGSIFGAGFTSWYAVSVLKSFTKTDISKVRSMGWSKTQYSIGRHNRHRRGRVVCRLRRHNHVHCIQIHCGVWHWHAHYSYPHVPVRGVHS